MHTRFASKCMATFNMGSRAWMNPRRAKWMSKSPNGNAPLGVSSTSRIHMRWTSVGKMKTRHLLCVRSGELGIRHLEAPHWSTCHATLCGNFFRVCGDHTTVATRVTWDPHPKKVIGSVNGYFLRLSHF